MFTSYLIYLSSQLDEFSKSINFYLENQKNLVKKENYNLPHLNYSKKEFIYINHKNRALITANRQSRKYSKQNKRGLERRV